MQIGDIGDTQPTYQLFLYFLSTIINDKTSTDGAEQLCVKGLLKVHTVTILKRFQFVYLYVHVCIYVHM